MPPDEDKKFLDLPSNTTKMNERKLHNQKWAITCTLAFMVLLASSIVLLSLITFQHVYMESAVRQRYVDYDKILQLMPPAKADFKTLSRSQRALKLGKPTERDNVNCLAGMDFDAGDIQDDLDIQLGELIEGVELKKAPFSYAKSLLQKCKKNLNNSSSQETFKIVYGKILDVEEFVDRISSTPTVSLAEGITLITLKFYHDLGIDILFNLRTFYNPDKNDKYRKMISVLSQKIPPKLDPAVVALAERGAKLTSRRTGAPNILQFFNHSANSRLMQTRYRTEPKVFEVQAANDKWPIFDFRLFFREMDYPRNDKEDEVEFKVAMESTIFLDELSYYVKNTQKQAAFSFLYYLGFYTTLHEYHEHFVLEQYERGWPGKLKVGAKALFSDAMPLKGNEANRRCGAMMRENLPILSSALYVNHHLDESDRNLMVTEELSVWRFAEQIFGPSKKRRSLEKKPETLYRKTLLPLAEPDVAKFHRRLAAKDLNGTVVDVIRSLRHFKRLRDVLALQHSDWFVASPYYSDSLLTPLPIYVGQENALYIPPGILSLLQRVYDMHAEHLDSNSRLEKTISTLKCLLRRERRKMAEFNAARHSVNSSKTAAPTTTVEVLESIEGLEDHIDLVHNAGGDYF